MHVVPFFGARTPLVAIEPRRVKELVSSLADQGKAPNTIRVIIAPPRDPRNRGRGRPYSSQSGRRAPARRNRATYVTEGARPRRTDGIDRRDAGRIAEPRGPVSGGHWAAGG